MDNKDLNINSETLRHLLEEEKSVYILDVRPKEQREEWSIPGSNYVDAYKRLNEGDLTVLNEIKIPQNTKVIIVCAAGRTSQIAASELRKRGIEAYSLEEGMKGWSLSWNTAEIEDNNLKIVQVRRTGKGCLSYVLGSEGEAIVVDASLDPEIYLAVAKQNGWKIKYVIDTHIHADHLSRSLALSEISGGTLYMPDQDKLKYAYSRIKDNDELQFGTSVLRALHTPGHTMDSTTYMIDNKYLLTGDTLFTNGVGRPDLKASEAEAAKRASILYNSLMKLLGLDYSNIVLPGHISRPVPFDHKIISMSLKEIKETVSTLHLSEDEFIRIILSKIPPTPPNYLKIVELNFSGDLNSVDPKEVEAGANRCAIS